MITFNHSHHPNHILVSKSPQSFRQLSESIEKRNQISAKKNHLQCPNKKSPLFRPKEKQYNKIFTNLLESRSPSNGSKLSSKISSFISNFEGSSLISKGSEIKSPKQGKEEKKSTVTGLQFKGIKQKINSKKSPTKVKSPSKFINGLIIGKKLPKKTSLLEKENYQTLNFKARPTASFAEADESVVHSRQGALVFDMSPTL